jgi:hypothetical protein
MPEFNKRVVVTGVKEAEKEYDAFVRAKLRAQKSAEESAKDLKQIAADAERAIREAAGGR